MKIYTRTGDKGRTSLLSGRRVPKYNRRIDAYGTVDELNSILGMLRALHPADDILLDIMRLQNELFALGANLAVDSVDPGFQLPHIPDDSIEWMENRMDEMEAQLSPLTHFVLPGSDLFSSWAHIARTVCRRAERLMVELADNEKVDEFFLVYINRLSDYLFMLSRRLSADSGADEIIWKPQ